MTCQQHNHFVGTGPISTRHTEYDIGWEHCVDIEANVKARRNALEAERDARDARPTGPDINATKDIAAKIKSGEIK